MISIDEAIKFCHEKSENIKLKAEPQTFIDIALLLEELKELRKGKREIPIATVKFNKEDLQELVDEKVKEIELDIQAIRNKAIDDCLYMVQSIKDKHNEDKSYPINYGTICGLIIGLQDLKDGDKNVQ